MFNGASSRHPHQTHARGTSRRSHGVARGRAAPSPWMRRRQGGRGASRCLRRRVGEETRANSWTEDFFRADG
ncbi:hypothetical protein C8Q76DRAFT_737463 [Earliella scabrosa]|nr:hypothetical protein C8Q76DRAFT_737463 [Earliella scabrosa]